jgi:putative DNA primase/helicase
MESVANDRSGHTHQLAEEHWQVPEQARRHPAWVGFRFEHRDGKRTKVPYNPRTGRRAASNRPETWATFEEVREAAGYEAVGYMLSAEDDFFLADLDGHRDPETGEISPEARRLIAPFEGKAYIEASTSGRGIHVFGRGSKPGAEWCKRGDLGIELYDWGRPVVFTGKTLPGSTSELADCQAELAQLYFEAMPEHLKNPPPPDDHTSVPERGEVDLADDELLQKAASSKYGDEFRALWSGDISVAGGDHSSADYRLLKTLMYWTGGDEARALDLFDKSALAKRAKWRRADYRHRTARKARMACRSFYQPHSTEGQRATPEQLAALVADLERRWWDSDWARLVGTGERPNSMRGHTCRDVMKVLIDAGASHGKITAEGLLVSLGRRTIALRAATSLRTVHKAVKHLEAEGWLEFKAPASEEKPGSYLLHANLHQVLYQHTVSQGSGEGEGEVVKGGGEDLRSPRLRWSYVARVWTPEGFEYEYIRRLGKIRCAVLDALDRWGGAATVDELASAFNKRPYDLRTRTLPMLEEVGIITISRGDLVSLTDNWLEALECERALKGEIAARRRDESRYRREREAYRNRHKDKADPAPSEQELAVGREDRLKAREVDKLVTQGMARSFARAVVFKDSDPFGDEGPHPDGYITELGVLPRRPDKVNGIYQHGPDCLCEWCAEDLQPRYARIRETA